MAAQAFADWNIQIYPNPSMGMVHIDVPSAVVLDIFKLTGKQVVQYAKRDNQVVIDIRTLAAGIYTLVLIDPVPQKCKAVKSSIIE